MALSLGGWDLLEDAQGIGQALPSGGHGGEQPGREEDPGLGGRVPGIGGELEGGIEVAQGKGAFGSSSGHRGWSVGILVAVREIFPNIREQVLAAQDAEHPELPSQVPPGPGQDPDPGDLERGEPEGSKSSSGRFVKAYEDKYPKATECLLKDQEVLLTFYDFPASHWVSIRTTNPIESTFATIRHRTRQARGCFSRESLLALVFQVALSSEKRFRKIAGIQVDPEDSERYGLVDGVERSKKSGSGKDEAECAA